MKRNLEHGSRLYLMRLGATEENHPKQLSTESARKHHTVFF